MHKLLNSITVIYIEMSALQMEWVNLYIADIPEMQTEGWFHEGQFRKDCFRLGRGVHLELLLQSPVNEFCLHVYLWQLVHSSFIFLMVFTLVPTRLRNIKRQYKLKCYLKNVKDPYAILICTNYRTWRN